MDTNTKAKGVFETLNAVDVSAKVDKKKTGYTELTYLSWAWAWAEAVKRYPNIEYEVLQNAEGQHYFVSPFGIEARTRVTIEGQTREMWLPVMDGANRALKAEAYTVKTKNGDMTIPPATMTDINKTIMRCLVKNLAMFGLGLYIYAGEDLPEGVEPSEPRHQPPAPPRPTQATANPARPSEAELAATPAQVAKKREVPRNPNPRAAAAWNAFRSIEDIAARPKEERDMIWQKTLLAAVKKSRISDIKTDAEWDRVDEYINLIKGEIK